MVMDRLTEQFRQEDPGLCPRVPVMLRSEDCEDLQETFSRSLWRWSTVDLRCV